MKIPKALKPVRLKYIQVNTKEGIVRYNIGIKTTYGDVLALQKMYAAKHGVKMNMVGAYLIEVTKKLK